MHSLLLQFFDNSFFLLLLLLLLPTITMSSSLYAVHAGLNRLAEALYKRRSAIRDLITTFRTSSRDPFPNWTANQQVAVASQEVVS